MFVGYARISTTDQNADLQIDALQEAGCGNVFVETASGAQGDRPQLRAAIASTVPGDILAVWKLDRLGRSLLHMIETIRELDQRGVGFISLTESINTTTSTGRLILHLFGAIAEFERSMILERTKAGLRAARARGRIGGRPRKLGDKEMAQARAMLQETDLSVAQMAMQLGVSESTFYSYFPGLHRVRRASPAVR